MVGSQLSFALDAAYTVKRIRGRLSYASTIALRISIGAMRHLCCDMRCASADDSSHENS
jgi:hypothetical protein